jgi:hypothetical protein
VSGCTRQLTVRLDCRIAPAAQATHCPSAWRRSIVPAAPPSRTHSSAHQSCHRTVRCQATDGQTHGRLRAPLPSRPRTRSFPIGVGRGVTLGVGREEREVDSAIAAEHRDSSGRARHADLAAKPRVAQALHDANPVAGLVLPGHLDAQARERVRQLRPRHSRYRLQFLSRHGAAEARGAVGDRLEPEPQDDGPLAHTACEGDEEDCSENGAREDSLSGKPPHERTILVPPALPRSRDLHAVPARLPNGSGRNLDRLRSRSTANRRHHLTITS